MNKNTNELVDPRLAELEAWKRLLTNNDFQLVYKYIKYRKKVIDSDKRFLGNDASFDNAVKALTLLARENELDTLINKVEFEKRQIRKSEEEKNNG